VLRYVTVIYFLFPLQFSFYFIDVLHVFMYSIIILFCLVLFYLPLLNFISIPFIYIYYYFILFYFYFNFISFQFHFHFILHHIMSFSCIVILF